LWRFPHGGDVDRPCPDFLCGDTVYADGVVASVPLPDGSPWRTLVIRKKIKVAETVDEFRCQYKRPVRVQPARTVAKVRRRLADLARLLLPRLGCNPI